MASTSLVAPESTRQLTPVEQRAVELMVRGVPRGKIAQSLAKGDLKAYRHWHKRLTRLAITPEAKAEASLAAQATMILGLGPASAALVRRAKRGRVDAIKLLFESTGFHNPKVSHEHSGEVKISLNMPRPPVVENNDQVVDGHVVEE
jgi:hypothetical protein